MLPTERGRELDAAVAVELFGCSGLIEVSKGRGVGPYALYFTVEPPKLLVAGSSPVSRSIPQQLTAIAADPSNSLRRAVHRSTADELHNSAEVA